jgi:peptide/nickel transport system permease protein
LLGFVLRRLGLMALMLAGLVVITFLVSNVAPADPAMLAAGPDATPDMIATIRHEYGLDKPLPVQFLRYVEELAQGRLGHSIVTGHAVTRDLATFLPATLELVLLGMLIAVVVGIPLGMCAAVRRDRAVDHLARIFAVSGMALPEFWIGLLLLLIFSGWLGWLPIGGQLSIADIPPKPITGMVLLDALLRRQFAVFWEALRHAILPAVVISLPALASVVRVNRAEMIEVVHADYITAARAHGISRARIVGVLALKNAMLPTLAMIGLRFGWMLGSTVLVETVFDWPGIGLYAVNSAVSADFKPVMGTTLAIGVLFMLANLLVDLAYGWLDPRVREAGE